MGLKEFIANLRERRARASEMEVDDRIQTKIVQKKKTANERELERFLEEDRQKQIKHDLEEFRKRKRDEFNYGHQILKVRTMFGGGKKPEVMRCNHSFLKTNRNLLIQRRLF